VEDTKALAKVLAMKAESVFGRRTARVLGFVALFVVGYESKLANKENPRNLDLSWADLGKVDSNNSKLPNAALSGVRLGGAILSNADLSKANGLHSR
jgi:uncharacterized protein YjbI with pentapeptide repeats